MSDNYKNVLSNKNICESNRKRITFRIKTGYYDIKMNLLGSPKSKITKNEYGENVSNLEINEVV